MASPRRTRHNHGHGHNQSLISDYESDVHYHTDAPGPPITRTNEELNLSVLARYRPDIINLEYVVPYVVVYTFSPETLGWEKSGMEGSTFLCGLSPNAEYAYRCAVVVLNRRGLDNLNIELVNTESVDITEEYVIIKHETAGQTNIYGLWVFREPPPSSTSHHPEAFAAKVQECVRKAENSKRQQPSVQQNGHWELEEGVPMGRQISLRQLFGKQRQEDDTWSVRSHSPSRHTSNTHSIQASIVEHSQVSNTQQPQVSNAPHFTTSADTDFFRSAPTQAQAVSSQPLQPVLPTDQQQTLLDLFRKASEQRGA